MSFYTALTGLNGSQADIAATSNNIANVGTTGFKRSRAEFGDIFATSPLQNSSSSIGSGSILKGVRRERNVLAQRQHPFWRLAERLLAYPAQYRCGPKQCAERRLPVSLGVAL